MSSPILQATGGNCPICHKYFVHLPNLKKHTDKHPVDQSPSFSTLALAGNSLSEDLAERKGFLKLHLDLLDLIGFTAGADNVATVTKIATYMRQHQDLVSNFTDNTDRALYKEFLKTYGSSAYFRAFFQSYTATDLQQR